MAASLFSKLLAITEEYMGPAADRFLRRQIQFHLGKPPEKITKRDVSKLSEWVKVSIGLLTEDKKMVDEVGAKINNLAK